MTSRLVAVCVVLAVCLVLALPVWAQGPGGGAGPPGQPPFPAGQPGPGPGPFPGGPGPGPMMFPPFMQMMPQAPAIAIADGKVFVVQGGTIYKFDAATLELEKQVQFIQMPQRPRPPMGGPGVFPPPPAGGIKAPGQLLAPQQ